MYMYKIMKSLKVFFSETAWTIFAIHMQGLFWSQIFVREKIPFGKKQWEIFKFSEIFFFARSDKLSEIFFFFFFFFVKTRFCIRIVCISIIIAYFVMYSKSG